MKKILNESVKFTAIIETTYIPKAVYEVAVRFGNKRIRFDPMEGRLRTIEECIDALAERNDIKNLAYVIEDFIDTATNLLKRYYDDGFKRH